MHTSVHLQLGIRGLLALLLPLALLPLMALPARAAGFTVTTLTDSGAGSLRQAIDQANGTSGADTITFTLSGTIVLQSTLPAITDTLTIDGSGQSITISGNNAVQAIVVNRGTTLNVNALTIAIGLCNNCNGGGISNDGGTVNVDYSTFSGNSAPCSSFCVASGGGIYNNGGSVMVRNSTFSSNSARTGGGIYNNGGSVTVSNSAFTDNSSSSDGAGMFNWDGSVAVSNSTFAGNMAGFDGGGIQSYLGTLEVSNSTFSGNSGYEGGGMMNDHGTLRVSNSSFSDNHADRYGGGGIDSAGDRLTVTNSTFSGNSGGIGGGIFIGSAAGGVSTVTNSTFAGNTAQTGGGIGNFASALTVTSSTFAGNVADTGGGIYNNSGSMTVRNSIIANSTAGGDCYGTISTDSHNFASDGSCGGATVKSSGELKLGPLADNGGATQTIALLAGSVAIDAGDDAVCAAAPVNKLDQRGVARPQGAHCDSGAFELEQEASDTTAPTITISSPVHGAVYQLGQSVAASYACQDENGGSGLASCTGTVASGASIDTASVGSHTFSVQAADNAGNSASKSVTYQVVYNWAGFFQPIDNLPTVNSAKAGSAIPVKFSLGGNYGLNIFASGYPKVQQVACASGAPIDEIEQTVTAGASGLQYDAATNTYSYTWKTDKAWAGSCRQLVLKLVDGTEHIASFTFH